MFGKVKSSAHTLWRNIDLWLNDYSARWDGWRHIDVDENGPQVPSDDMLDNTPSTLR